MFKRTSVNKKNFKTPLYIKTEKHHFSETIINTNMGFLKKEWYRHLDSQLNMKKETDRIKTYIPKSLCVVYVIK